MRHSTHFPSFPFCAFCTALLEDLTVSRGFSEFHRLKKYSNRRILNTHYANKRQFRSGLQILNSGFSDTGFFSEDRLLTPDSFNS
jgi:hypothetical protein